MKKFRFSYFIFIMLNKTLFCLLCQLFMLNFCQAKLGICTSGFTKDPSLGFICNKDSLGAKRNVSEFDCVFPFELDNVLFYNCVKTKNMKGYWCSLDQKFIGRFSTCDSSCPKQAAVKEPNHIHTWCLPDTIGQPIRPYLPDLNSQGVITGFHNKIRAEVKPAAADMSFVHWDNKLAYTAVKWAKNLTISVFEHDCLECRQDISDRSMFIGQNLYMEIGGAFTNETWRHAMKAWYDEIFEYTYDGKNSCIL